MSAPAARKAGPLVAAGLALVAVLSGCSSGPRATAHTAVQEPSPSPTSSATASPSGLAVPPGASLIATATVHRLAIDRTPGGRVGWRFRNPNNLGAPLVFLVIGSQPGWWQVRVPSRPNESVGWVSTAQVRVEIDPYAISAVLHRHVATVYRYGHVLWRLKVGVGRPSAPTPTGRFYLTELLLAPNPHGPYGPYAYGTSAFSDVYSEFEGGNGQIGVHGTNDPTSIGVSVSHGCIRLRNADIRRLAQIIPPGTPLTITR